MDRIGPLILYSLFTGGLVGLLLIPFGLLLGFLTEHLGLLFGYLPPSPPGARGVVQAFTGPGLWALAFLLPPLYALLSFLGPGLGLEALLGRARQGLTVPPWTYPRALLGGLLQLSLYSPLGQDGPYGTLGLWLGGGLDRRFPGVGGGLLFAGLGAGLGAALHAPVAGALLATEILYPGLRLEARALTPALLGALAGFSVYGAYFGYAPLLGFGGEVGWAAIPVGLLLGALAALLATGVALGGKALESLLKPWPFPLRHALLGLALGLALLFLPEALGVGLGWVAVATSPLLPTLGLLYLLPAKLLLLLLALGSRAYGGVLLPALALGGLLGGLVGRGLGGFHLPPEALALAGGTAVLAALARAPFGGIVLAAEWGGYGVLPLVLPAVFLAYALTPTGGPEGRGGPRFETPPQTPPPPPGPEAASGPGTPPG